MLSLIGIAGLIALGILLARKQRLISFCIFWFLGNLVIESSIFPIAIIFEHCVYLPSMLVGFALFFYMVGDRDLWAPDEDEYAQMSREMIRFNNWAFPTVNGQPWAIKPVLYNWLIA
ncbi:MAG: hypothetical protein GY850_02855, partial [bacterium]|nr:hypothetical protein [bacterium]